jgi:hypothetical protein
MSSDTQGIVALISPSNEAVSHCPTSAGSVETIDTGEWAEQSKSCEAHATGAR